MVGPFSIDLLMPNRSSLPHPSSAVRVLANVNKLEISCVPVLPYPDGGKGFVLVRSFIID